MTCIDPTLEKSYCDGIEGIKGKFGLGLSIVKQSLELYGYNIKVSNEEKGVLFEIE